MPYFPNPNDPLVMWGTPRPGPRQPQGPDGVPSHAVVPPGSVATGPHTMYGPNQYGPGQVGAVSGPAAAPLNGRGGDPMAVLNQLMNMYRPAGATPIGTPAAAPSMAPAPGAGGDPQAVLSRLMSMYQPQPGQLFGGGGGMGMGGEGGAMGGNALGGGGPPAATPPPAGVGQRTVAQGVGAPNAPPQGSTTPPPATPATSHKYTYDQIAFIANAIDPEMATLMGFGPSGKSAGTWGHDKGFFDWMEMKNMPQGKDRRGDPYVTDLPTEFSPEDFKHWFLNENRDLQALYGTRNNPALHRIDAVNFLQKINDVMFLAENGLNPDGTPITPGQPPGSGPVTPPGTPPPVTTPGNWSDEQRAAFMRPYSTQEQNLFTMLQAATTGKVTPSGDQQARIQAMMNADLAKGISRPVGDYIRMVGQAQESNPGSYLYDAARGELPDVLAQDIEERVLMSMGNIGARFSAGTGGAVASALSRTGHERALQAQQQVQQLQTQAALIDAQREQQAQQALYQDFLRNAPITERENLQMLFSLLGLNVGGATSGSTSIGGGTDAAIAAALQGAGALAGVIPTINWTGGSGGASNTTTPTVLPPDYYS